MLLEAQLTGDAQYALKGIPSLADALTRQGIEMISYAPERAQDFDLLPAPVGGRTIRPACVRAVRCATGTGHDKTVARQTLPSRRKGPGKTALRQTWMDTSKKAA